MDSHFNLIYDLLPKQTKLKKPEVIDKPIRRDVGQPKVAEEEEKKDPEPINLPKLPNVNKRKAKLMRKAGDDVWLDETLEQWPENDFRIFCGNMGNEVNDEVLSNAFKKYGSFAKAKIVRDKKTLKSKGFGFVSLTNVDDYIRAMREMQGKYVGNRPITLKKSDWKDKSVMKK